jgi:hypothetical protein
MDLGTTAPDASLTVPKTVPNVDCPSAAEEQSAATKKAEKQFRKTLFGHVSTSGRTDEMDMY